MKIHCEIMLEYQYHVKLTSHRKWLWIAVLLYNIYIAGSWFYSALFSLMSWVNIFINFITTSLYKIFLLRPSISWRGHTNGCSTLGIWKTKMCACANWAPPSLKSKFHPRKEIKIDKCFQTITSSLLECTAHQRQEYKMVCGGNITTVQAWSGETRVKMHTPPYLCSSGKLSW